MKLNYAIIFVIIFIFNSSAQITTRDSNITKPKPKLIQYDSLANIGGQYKYADFRQYIGYKLFFRPVSENYKIEPNSIIGKYDFLFSKMPELDTPDKRSTLNDVANQAMPGVGGIISGFSKNFKKSKTNVYEGYRTTTSGGEDVFYTKREAVEGKYFTILDIRVKINDDPKAGYQKLEDVVIDMSRKQERGGETSSFDELVFTLRNESNQDIVYWKNKPTDFRYTPFFIVAYFEKQKKMYLDKNLVTTSTMHDFVDIKTGQGLVLTANKTWLCYDVSFTGTKEIPYLHPFLFLKNSNNSYEVQLDMEKGFDKSSSPYDKYGGYKFMFESDFIKQENKRQQEELEAKNKQLEEEKLANEEKAKLKSSYVKKYGAKLGGLIAEGKVALGMNKEMCRASWGEPSSINRSVHEGLTTEQWVYNMQTYLYFYNGVLKSIQD